MLLFAGTGILKGVACAFALAECVAQRAEM